MYESLSGEGERYMRESVYIGHESSARVGGPQGPQRRARGMQTDKHARRKAKAVTWTYIGPGKRGLSLVGTTHLSTKTPLFRQLTTKELLTTTMPKLLLNRNFKTIHYELCFKYRG